jgi:predicted ArsR family transcriptional regulator
LDEAARLLGIGKGTAQRAFAELQEKGFLRMTRKGQWYGRRATTWRTTDKGCNVSLSPKLTEPSMPTLTQKAAFAIIRGLGFTIKRTEAFDYRLARPGDRDDRRAYFTDDLQNAVEMARAMAAWPKRKAG